MKNDLPYGATGYCPMHNLYFGSITDTVPATICPLCGIAKELRAQPAPRTYEVARALSWVDAVEASCPAEPASLGAEAAIYWLIEWKQYPEPCTYLHPTAEWLSRGVHDWTVESVRIEKWTKDTKEAIRFPSKEDAEAVIGWLWGRETSIYAATEHMDI